MRNWSNSIAATRQITFLVFERFSNHGLANLMEPFRAANSLLRRQAYRWQIITPDDGPVTSSSGLPVMPTMPRKDLGRGDLLFVISSYGQKELATPAGSAMLRSLARQHRRVGSIDTGSWLLAQAGLLDGRRATIHFDLSDTFAERFPQVDVERMRWVEDGDRITCGGAMAGFDLACELIGQDHGTALVLEIGQMFLSGMPVQPRTVSRLGGDRRVDRCLSEMAANIETPLSLPELARRAGCRQRDLEQRFRKLFGASPQKVYRRLRLDASKRMLQEGGLAVAEVALRSGYADASAFARAFREEYGAPPRAFLDRGVG
ncbi:HTH-type transcriptional regulator CdhR [Aliiroseovarius pelagivivens]|uniref:HTH-type transcriptional regulator CdhR n=1 Tax=Aliiroseovarius pelagivivens TaxID=1639690 RepID=A0A2R8AJT4_9RHOB|nr:GlxA family transcriptional regulator [Aliiroseovarius pelagivivens]SPF76127.1 HTH-type transcriptional regulator CdhR [Aliiroseovarius pelagivivens]